MDKTEIAVAVFNDCAQAYQDRFMDQGLYHDSFDCFCNHIALGNADILEIACGPGNITQYLLRRRPDFKILGIDLAPNMIALAEINNPGAEFQLMDGRDIRRLNKKYAGIMCGFCLPYLSKEETINLIRDAALLLHPGGILYLSTMEENDYNQSGLKKSSAGHEIYMYYHRADYLTAALQENGFKIIDLKRQDYPTQDGIQTTDLLIIAGK